LRFGFRPLPSMSFERLHECFATLVDAGALERYEETFRGPPLPAGDTADAEQRRLEARDLADALGLPIGNAVDFWTEASLFSAAGLAAIVFGPGDIAQAHAADEWVALDQLETAAGTYQRLFGGVR
jgi:acetylornithine deacetylase